MIYDDLPSKPEVISQFATFNNQRVHMYPITLWWFNIAIENCPLKMLIYPLNMVDLSVVMLARLPEGISTHIPVFCLIEPPLNHHEKSH